MNSAELYVVTGASGRTGAAVARTLLNAGKRVRVVVRDAGKGSIWANLGAEVVVASFTDIPGLRNALSGATGAYIISPPQYASEDLFTQAEIMASAIAEVVIKVQLPKIVALSSIGADRSNGTGLIAMNRILEQYLGQTGLPVTMLRAAYFMENWSPMIKAASVQGELLSFLSPLNRKIPMIATNDIGRIAAEALCEHWNDTRVIELEGPITYSPDDLANSLTTEFGKIVKSVVIPDWSEALSGSGMSMNAIEGFMEMTRALNSGHIAFTDNTNIAHRKGRISLDNAVATMISL